MRLSQVCFNGDGVQQAHDGSQQGLHGVEQVALPPGVGTSRGCDVPPGVQSCSSVARAAGAGTIFGVPSAVAVVGPFLAELSVLGVTTTVLGLYAWAGGLSASGCGGIDAGIVATGAGSGFRAVGVASPGLLGIVANWADTLGGAAAGAGAGGVVPGDEPDWPRGAPSTVAVGGGTGAWGGGWLSVQWKMREASGL
jgi:hypothetical protein